MFAFRCVVAAVGSLGLMTLVGLPAQDGGADDTRARVQRLYDACMKIGVEGPGEAILLDMQRQFDQLLPRVQRQATSWSGPQIAVAYFELVGVGSRLRYEVGLLAGLAEEGLLLSGSKPGLRHGRRPLLGALAGFRYEMGQTAKVVDPCVDLAENWPLDADAEIAAKGYWLAAEAARLLINQCREPGKAELILSRTLDRLQTAAPWGDEVRRHLLQDRDLWFVGPARDRAASRDDCMGSLLLLRGFARLELGHLMSAKEDLQEAQRYLLITANEHRLANVQHNLASVYLRLGKYGLAETAAKEAERYYRKPQHGEPGPDRNGIYAMSKVQAEVLLRRGADKQQIRELLQPVAESMRSPYAQTNVDAYPVWAEMLLVEPRTPEDLRELAELVEEARHRSWVRCHRPVWAKMLQFDAERQFLAGDLEMARAKLSEATQVLPDQLDVQVRQAALEGELKLRCGQPEAALLDFCRACAKVRAAVDEECLLDSEAGIVEFQAARGFAVQGAVRAFRQLLAVDPAAAAARWEDFYAAVQGFHGSSVWYERLLAEPLSQSAEERAEAKTLGEERERLNGEIDRMLCQRPTPGVWAVHHSHELAKKHAELERVASEWRRLRIGALGRDLRFGTVPLAAVQRALQPGELLVEFLQIGDAWAAVCVGGSTPELIMLGAMPEPALAWIVSEGRRGGANGEERQAGIAAVGAWLFGPASPLAARLAGVRTLLLSPEGELARVPFSALPHDGGALGDAFAISHVASGAVLAHLRGLPRSPTALREGVLLALANPRYAGGDSHRETVRSGIDVNRLGALPGTAREALAVARLFAEQGAETEGLTAIRAPEERDERHDGARFRLLLGAAARESSLDAELLRDVKFLHFACHGVADPESAAWSFLALSLLPDHPAEGLLRIDEFARLRGDYELVALSACETGAGPIRRHDGPASLARAAQAIGARRVLATLWRVDDGAAHKLVTSFYELWLHEGRGAAEALALAQREARAEGVPTREWAAFTLWGEPR